MHLVSLTGWLTFLLLYLLGPCFVQAALRTVIIDDANGDPETGRRISYSPPSLWRTNCKGCANNPDLSKLHKNTWHDVSSRRSSSELYQATVQFKGTSVSVKCVLTNRRTSEDADYLFYLDGHLAGRFTRSPSSGADYLYDQTVFSQANLGYAEHTLVIQVGEYQARNTAIMLDAVVYSYDDGTGSGSDSLDPDDSGQPQQGPDGHGSEHSQSLESSGSSASAAGTGTAPVAPQTTSSTFDTFSGSTDLSPSSPSREAGSDATSTPPGVTTVTAISTSTLEGASPSQMLISETVTRDAPSPTSTGEDRASALSSGMIALIASLSSCLTVVLLLVIFILLRRRRRNLKAARDEPPRPSPYLMARTNRTGLKEKKGFRDSQTKLLPASPTGSSVELVTESQSRPSSSSAGTSTPSSHLRSAVFYLDDPLDVPPEYSNDTPQLSATSSVTSVSVRL